MTGLGIARTALILEWLGFGMLVGALIFRTRIRAVTFAALSTVGAALVAGSLAGQLLTGVAVYPPVSFGLCIVMALATVGTFRILLGALALERQRARGVPPVGRS